MIPGAPSAFVCRQCGTCCVAPDISTLNKPVGVPCSYLDDNLCCSIYADRPPVCRGYAPDELCAMIAAPSLDERVQSYLQMFGINQQENGSWRCAEVASCP